MPKQTDKKKKTGLTGEQIDEIRDVFNLIDEDGSQRIDAMELRLAYKMILNKEISKEEAEAELAKFDHDGDLEIEFHEFLKLMKDVAGDLNMLEHADEQFRKFADYVGRPGEAKRRRTPAAETVEPRVEDLALSWHGLKKWSESLELNCQDEELQDMMHYLANAEEDELPVDTLDKVEAINFDRFKKILDLMGIINLT